MILLLTTLLAVQAHDHRPGERLGTVTFPISCNAEAQQRFTRAVAGLHSFYWEAGQSAFQAVADADSNCAMAYWGLAINAWGNPFAGGPGGNAGRALSRGVAFIERATQLGADPT
jgi:hypothetical protein